MASKHKRAVYPRRLPPVDGRASVVVVVVIAQLDLNQGTLSSRANGRDKNDGHQLMQCTPAAN